MPSTDPVLRRGVTLSSSTRLASEIAVLVVVCSLVIDGTDLPGRIAPNDPQWRPEKGPEQSREIHQ